MRSGDEAGARSHFLQPRDAHVACGRLDAGTTDRFRWNRAVADDHRDLQSPGQGTHEVLVAVGFLAAQMMVHVNADQIAPEPGQSEEQGGGIRPS